MTDTVTADDVFDVGGNEHKRHKTDMISWVVRLSWLQIAYPFLAHFFRRTILTRKVGQTDLGLVCDQVH